MKIMKLKTIDSTHLYALRLIEDSNFFIDKGVAIVADEQTNGIGRCKRRWISTKGNLFVSIIMEMPENANLGQISLTSACAVRETIAYYLKDAKNDLKLHWPNDVYYQKKKISGMLLATSGGFLIISVGINVNSSPDIDRPSISIREILRHSCAELHQEELLGILLKNIDEQIYCLCNVGFSDVRSYWLRNISDIACKAAIKNGGSVLNGIFLDIDDSGRAVLECSGQHISISSGDLFMEYGCE